MAYAERRKGRLTGHWYADMRHKGKHFRERFETKAAAEAYENHVELLGYA